MTNPITARIEVFRPGTFTPMDGAPITYSAADLRAIADAYDPATAPAPIVVGHPDTDAPAFGWIDRLEFDGASDRLYADLGAIEPAFADAVKAGRYRKVSMAFFRPDQSHNPVPGTWYPKHLGFLGAAAPAVSGLKNASFAGVGGVTFTAAFGDPGLDETASILRSLRDFFISKFGLEDADAALPSWRIEWLGEMAAAAPVPAVPLPAFSAPLPEPSTHTQKKEPAVAQNTDPAFATREADLAARESRLAAREAELSHADHVAFAEGLVQEGRLLPASRDKVVAILDALPGHAAVSFAEGGEKLTPGDALRDVLKAQPKVVSFGAADLGDHRRENSAAVAAFAADGKPVDPAALEIHQKAIDHQRRNPGTSFIDAVRAVS